MSGQKADYFSKVLNGLALKFFLKAYVSGMTHGEIAKAKNFEYKSDSRKLQVQSSLEGPTLHSFIAPNSLNTEY